MTIVNFRQKQPHWIEVNVNDGSSMIVEWYPELDDVFEARLSFGLETDEEFTALPKDQKAKIYKLANGRIPEVLGHSTGPYIIAPAIKEFLEVNEPGVHQFAPVLMQTPRTADGSDVPILHWLLRSPPLVDCLVLEGSIFKKDIRGENWERVKDKSKYWGGGLSRDRDNPCVFDAEQVEGRHLWRFKEGDFFSSFACSDEFWTFFKQNKFLGWKSEKTCQLV